MSFKEFCVSSVNFGFENLSDSMEDGEANIQGVLQDMPSIEKLGQSLGSTSTSNEVMPRYRYVQALYKATSAIEKECLILFEEPTAYSKASQEDA